MPENQPQLISNEVLADETKLSTILVVDDDNSSRGLVKKILEQEDYIFEGAGSGEEALEYLNENLPDLILCDILMPEMDGIEFCARLQLTPVLENIPLIMVTGMSTMDSLSRAYEAGADDYIIKPIRQVELLSRVEHHVEKYRREQAAKSKIENLFTQNESKTKFLGVASHDLRNPLVSIRGISQYLDSEKFGPLNESQKELVSTIVQASESMLSLVEDLLDVSMFESGQMRIETNVQSLEELIDHAITLHSPNASKKSIRLVKGVRSSDNDAEFDNKLISRVIDNLISNAVKFSQPETEVRLLLESEEDSVTLKVEDQGPGIPHEEFDTLFKEFGRTSNLPTGGESSSGIGLFVCKKILQQHGGSISAENRSEGGARFNVTLNRSINNG